MSYHFCADSIAYERRDNNVRIAGYLERVFGNGKRVLVVEDEEDIGALVELHLRDVGFAVSRAASGREAWQALRDESFDLLVLDRMLPDMDGLDICRKLRKDKDYTPALILTARSSEMDRVLGLETGADDYLTKPFSVPELLARVKAILRRVAIHTDRRETQQETVELGDIVIDRKTRSVRVAGASVTLTAKEYDLLVEFITHPGRVFSRDQLLERVVDRNWIVGYLAGYQHFEAAPPHRCR